MTERRGYERLVAVNPIPDPEGYVEQEFGAVPIGDVDAILGSHGEVRTGRWAPARPLLALVAFAAVFAVGVGGLLLANRSDRVPVGNDPVEVVTAFFDRWNDGDVDAALELLDPEVTINVGFNSLAELRGLMEYAAAWGADMDVACRATELAGSVSCEWEWEAASVAALGLDGPNTRRFQVSGGLITSLVTPSYGAHEDAISAYARRVDPEGFAAACDPNGAASVSAYGFVFDAECGRFLAGLEESFIEELGSGP